MGIGNGCELLKEFKSPVVQDIHLSQLRGTKVGVDATLWLSTVYNALGDHEKERYWIFGV